MFANEGHTKQFHSVNRIMEVSFFEAITQFATIIVCFGCSNALCLQFALLMWKELNYYFFLSCKVFSFGEKSKVFSLSKEMLTL